MLCAIWYHLHNLKNLKSTHGGVLFLVMLQALKLLHACFSSLLNCTNCTKWHNVSHIISTNKYRALSAINKILHQRKVCIGVSIPSTLSKRPPLSFSPTPPPPLNLQTVQALSCLGNSPYILVFLEPLINQVFQ